MAQWILIKQHVQMQMPFSGFTQEQNKNEICGAMKTRD